MDSEHRIADGKSPELLKVVERAKDPRFTCLALAYLVDEAAPTRAYHRLRADGITKEQYGHELERNIRDLHDRLWTQRWRHKLRELKPAAQRPTRRDTIAVRATTGST